ncbi:phage major capsid protein [Cytobacillus firmus]|uniref:phage major capsid protein n=1 Tax=Cytobacillus firmus TaxID=1399 RepID=UPI0021C71634|nr:phage major capsid protein [Cytobacillus firmus]MCU1805165.1 phage major capsid protein [Cytobacillus firmus]
MNNKIELRVHELELRAKEDGTLKVSGYVNKTEQFSEVLGSAKRFVEKISKGAFNRAIMNAKEISFLAEHDSKKILASTRNGSLKLREDAQGLYMEAEIVPTSYGTDTYELIKSGIFQNMSFGFRTLNDSWKQGVANIYERTINELELFEVSVVKNPAYSQSTIAARGIDLIEDVQIPNLENEKEKLNQMKTELRYNTTKNEIEIRKENEIREFNDNLRDLQMTSGVSSVIPETVADMIVEKIDELSPVFARAKKFKSVNGSLKIPRETAVGVGMFVGEAQNLIEDSMSLGEISLNQKRVGSYMALTRQLINDAAIQMEVYVPNLLGKRVFKAVEQSILRGTSVEEFRGIVPDSDIQSFNVTANASDVELLDALLDMTLNIHPEYLAKSQFIMSRPFFNRVSKLKDAAGHFYVQNGVVNGKPTQTLFGLEVLISSSLENGDAAGQTPVILGSMEDGYAVMVKKGANMTLIQDTDHALRGSVGFLFDCYLDGCVFNSDAFSKLVIV